MLTLLNHNASQAFVIPRLASLSFYYRQNLIPYSPQLRLKLTPPWIFSGILQSVTYLKPSTSTDNYFRGLKSWEKITDQRKTLLRR